MLSLFIPLSNWLLLRSLSGFRGGIVANLHKISGINEENGRKGIIGQCRCFYPQSFYISFPAPASIPVRWANSGRHHPHTHYQAVVAPRQFATHHVANLVVRIGKIELPPVTPVGIRETAAQFLRQRARELFRHGLSVCGSFLFLKFAIGLLLLGGLVRIRWINCLSSFLPAIYWFRSCFRKFENECSIVGEVYKERRVQTLPGVLSSTIKFLNVGFCKYIKSNKYTLCDKS